jgi:hypothetical protein
MQGTPKASAQNRRRSRIGRSRRVIGCRFIAPRRSNIAHLRRPWHATLRQGMMERRRVVVSALSFAFPTTCRRRSYRMPAVINRQVVSSDLISGD